MSRLILFMIRRLATARDNPSWLQCCCCTWVDTAAQSRQSGETADIVNQYFIYIILYILLTLHKLDLIFNNIFICTNIFRVFCLLIVVCTLFLVECRNRTALPPCGSILQDWIKSYEEKKMSRLYSLFNKSCICPFIHHILEVWKFHFIIFPVLKSVENKNIFFEILYIFYFIPYPIPAPIPSTFVSNPCLSILVYLLH